MLIGVRVMPRQEVLDSQGRAVEDTLRSHGKAVQGVRVGKYVKLDLPGSNRDQAMAKAKEIAEFVLCNPLIETFELEVIE